MISSAFHCRIPRNTDGPIRNAVLRSHPAFVPPSGSIEMPPGAKPFCPGILISV